MTDKKSNHIQFPDKWSVSQLAALLQQDRRTVSEKLIKFRVPFEDGPKNSKLYVLENVLKCLYGKVSHNETGEEGGEIMATPMTPLDREKLLLITAKREKEELDLAVKKKEYVAVSEVVETVSKEYGTVRTQLRALPSRLSKHVANSGDAGECYDLISKAVEDALSELQSDAESKIQQIADEQEINKDEVDTEDADTEELINDGGENV